MLEAAAIPLPVLPEELVCEILLRLPVRSLLQFKCVCNSWKTLISGSQFANSHLRISTSDPTMANQQLIFSHGKLPRKIVSYSLKTLFENPSTPVKPGAFDYPEDFYYIIGSCNGLLCLFDSSRCCVRLCNPSLRSISKLSSVPVSQDWCITQCGFGYDQVNDKYKVLLVVEINDYQILTKIYTFGQVDSWKTIPDFPRDIHGLFGKFVSGTLNWLVSNQKTFVSFDIDKETYMELLLPQTDGNKNLGIHHMLFVLRNCLCVSDYFATENFHLVLWMMKDYGVVESWTKFMIIPCDKFIQSLPCLVEPLFISPNGVLMVINHYQLILYNTNTGVASIIMKRVLYSHLHCDSLVSLPC